MLRQISDAKNVNSSLRYGVIVVHRTAADPDPTNEHAIFIHNGKSAGKGDQAVVGVLHPIERPTWLREPTNLRDWHRGNGEVFTILVATSMLPTPALSMSAKAFKKRMTIVCRNCAGSTHNGICRRR